MPAPDLVTAELTLTGRITTASNATFLGSIGDTAVVYKPIRGEKPLWDFPDGFLAHREVAAYLVSEALGWNIVPHTWLRDGPFGEGMVQLWKETDPEQSAVDLVAADTVPATGWKQVLEGQDEQGRMVALIHEDTPVLRRMAVFDVLANNADRKGDHILAMPEGHRYGVDHGLTFHGDHKLRTVLWGWLGDELTTEELEGVDRVRGGLRGSLGRELAELLTAAEISSLAARCAALHATARFPGPRSGMSAVPWPLF
ncbi:phosphatidylinositol kinase [Arthrobacter pityocampae]|uniref:Phosphatidylinositol kinase n=1 Tax=Arthrobacter pityocampae TaxID=547334 RepID=A0A2S5IUW2_9MICC|nr:SCO1664 family protein [Arthrobacter pityocampae]PPB48326.1 phosphatidylinositol kinase [Arthrobacter pityocampae]